MGITKIISKDNFCAFITAILRDYRVFAPVKKEEGYVSFSEITGAPEVFIGYFNSKKPPKELFFPQSEELFQYHYQEQADSSSRREPKLELQNEINARGIVLFGLRPCDTRSMLILDRVFSSGDYEDPYYIERRKKTVILTLACESPYSICFCTSVGGGPFDESGSDIFVARLSDAVGFVIKPTTIKGEMLIAKHDDLMNPADDKIMAKFKTAKEKSEEAISSRLKLDGIADKLDSVFDHPYWDFLHEKCVGCAICAYLCPTCHCFDITDEARDTQGARVRSWDSCMFPLFTLQASGYNPRPTGKERMRQRIMHKFNYFKTNYDELACVGCGRCIRSCPVNLDIRAVLGDIMALT